MMKIYNVQKLIIKILLSLDI